MPVTNEGLGSGFPNLKKGKTLLVTVILGGGVDPICTVILGETNEMLQDFLKSMPSQLWIKDSGQLIENKGNSWANWNTLPETNSNFAPEDRVIPKSE